MTGHNARRVTPFGNLRITGCLLLPAAFRSLPRPSSPDSSEASTMNPYSLDHILVVHPCVYYHGFHTHTPALQKYAALHSKRYDSYFRLNLPACDLLLPSHPVENHRMLRYKSQSLSVLVTCMNISSCTAKIQCNSSGTTRFRLFSNVFFL